MARTLKKNLTGNYRLQLSQEERDFRYSTVEALAVIGGSISLAHVAYKFARFIQIVEQATIDAETARQGLARAAAARREIARVQLERPAIASVDERGPTTHIEERPMVASEDDRVGKGAGAERNKFSPKYNPTGASAADELSAGGTRVGEDAKSPKYRLWEKAGGFAAANAQFDEMADNAGVKPKSYANGVRSITLDDGSTVSVRPNSSEGSPTIQVDPPTGKGTKIRYK